MVTYNQWNLSAFQQVNGSGHNPMVDLVQQTSIQTGYLPGAFIVVSLFLVLFFSLHSRGTPVKASLAAASFAVTVVALIIYPLMILSAPMYILCIMGTPISVIILFLTGDDSA